MNNGLGHFAFACILGMVSAVLWIVYFIRLQSKNYRYKMNKIQIGELEVQKRLLSDLITAQEKERARIAQNLHDEIGVQLSMLKLNLSRYNEDNCTKDSLLIGLNGELLNLEKTIEHISGICYDLYPSNLRRLGLIKCLLDLLANVENSTEISILSQHSVSEKDLFLDEDQKLNILRVCQELLNNILKHARPKTIQFLIEKPDQKCQIIFEHDGMPFTNEMACAKIKSGKSFGLNSIANRIQIAQGEINYQKTETGSKVHLKIPLAYETKN